MGPTVHAWWSKGWLKAILARGAKKGNFLVTMLRHSNISTSKVSNSTVLKAWSAELLNSRRGLTSILFCAYCLWFEIL